jgi:NADH-quinone oxidoreductase subunit J
LRGVSQVASGVGTTDIGLVKNLGQVLFNEFLFPFEVSSILLLAAMVGVVMVGKDEEHTKPNN